MWSGSRERTVKPSAQPTLVRIVPASKCDPVQQEGAATGSVEGFEFVETPGLVEPGLARAVEAEELETFVAAMFRQPAQ
jgi:hypothetical protein